MKIVDLVKLPTISVDYRWFLKSYVRTVKKKFRRKMDE